MDFFKIKRPSVITASCFLVLIALALIVYMDYVSLGELVDEQCAKIGLENVDGGNCCFVDDRPEDWLPQLRAVPCDNLDFIPLEQRLNQAPNIDFNYLIVD